jgi:hypothetical protein
MRRERVDDHLVPFAASAAQRPALPLFAQQPQVHVFWRAIQDSPPARILNGNYSIKMTPRSPKVSIGGIGLLAVSMCALGHKRTLKHFHPISALPPKADITGCDRDVRFVPKADIRCEFLSPSGSVELIVQPDAHNVVGCCHAMQTGQQINRTYSSARREG